MKVTTRQIGLGMIQQMQHVCPECAGSGNSRKEALILSFCFFLVPCLEARLLLSQVKPSAKEINAHSAKETRLLRKRRYWRCTWRKGCRTARRLCMRGKQMKR